MLGVGGIGVVADGLEAEHGDDVFVFVAAGLCVDAGAHLLGLEEGHFLVCEEEEAEGAVGPGVFEAAGECEICGDGGAVVVCAGRAEDGVVV